MSIKGMIPVSQDEYDRIVSNAELQKSAFARENFQQRTKDFLKIGPLDLSTERTRGAPFILPAPFVAATMKSSNDTSAVVKLFTGSNDDSVINDAYPMELGEKINFLTPIGFAGLVWDAQPNATAVYIYLSLNSKIEGGKTYSLNSGGISINEGSSCASTDKRTIDLAAADQTEILALNLNRKVTTLHNNTGRTLYIGDGNVTDYSGNYPGIPWQQDEIIKWRNTGPMNVYNPGAAIADANIAILGET